MKNQKETYNLRNVPLFIVNEKMNVQVSEDSNIEWKQVATVLGFWWNYGLMGDFVAFVALFRFLSPFLSGEGHLFCGWMHSRCIEYSSQIDKPVSIQA